MLTMYDDITLSLIPNDAPAVAGYVNGRWPTFPEVVRRWPKAHHLSIAVTSHADADCLDVEPGDATNAVAAGWVKRQRARGIHRPVVYTSLSNAAALLRALRAAGIARSDVRLWTAHYTHAEHLCGPACGFGFQDNADATQWTDKALGRSLDRSLCKDGFFGMVPKPPKPPKPPTPPPPPPPPPPADAMPSDLGFYTWAAWRLGTGIFAGCGPMNKAVRPGIPTTIPMEWWPALSTLGHETERRVVRSRGTARDVGPELVALQPSPTKEKRMTRKQISHALMALGAGIGVFLADAATITADPWLNAGCYAGMATLAAMGVGIAKRTP